MFVIIRIKCDTIKETFKTIVVGGIFSTLEQLFKNIGLKTFEWNFLGESMSIQSVGNVRSATKEPKIGPYIALVGVPKIYVYIYIYSIRNIRKKAICGA